MQSQRVIFMKKKFSSDKIQKVTYRAKKRSRSLYEKGRRLLWIFLYKRIRQSKCNSITVRNFLNSDV